MLVVEQCKEVRCGDHWCLKSSDDSDDHFEFRMRKRGQIMQEHFSLAQDEAAGAGPRER